jgi:hypothetical protein
MELCRRRSAAEGEYLPIAPEPHRMRKIMRNRLALLDYLSWVAVHLFWLLLMVRIVVLGLLVQYAFCDDALTGGHCNYHHACIQSGFVRH